MTKLTIMVGISASGKSTMAKEIVKEQQNTVIVSRDDIRKALFGYDENSISEYYKRDDLFELEKKVSIAQDSLISSFLSKKINVVLDNTNVKARYLNEIINKYSNFEIDFKVIECEPKEAIERDKKRDRTVGREVILNQYNSFRHLMSNFPSVDNQIEKIDNDCTKEACFIFDIDGTLAIKQDRSPFDENEYINDMIDDNVARTFDTIASTGRKIFICTGRKFTEKGKSETEKWLEQWGLTTRRTDVTLLGRHENDERKDCYVKEDMWREITKTHYIVAMFDDRRQVVDHARKLGFKVCQVEDNNF